MASLSSRKKKLTETVFISVCIGWFYCELLKRIPISFGIFDYVIMLFLAFAIGYITGKALTDDRVQLILDKLKIYISVNDSIWYDLMLDKNESVYIYIHSIDGTVYSGCVSKCEENVINPRIILYDYTITKSGKIVDECHNGKNAIMVNTSDMLYIKADYIENGVVYKTINRYIYGTTQDSESNDSFISKFTKKYINNSTKCIDKTPASSVESTQSET